MENQNQNTNVIPVSDGGDVSQPSLVGDVSNALNSGNLSDDSTIMATSSAELSSEYTPTYDEPLRERPRRHLFMYANIGVVVILVAAFSFVAYNLSQKKTEEKITSSVSSDYKTQEIPLTGFIQNSQGINFSASNVVVNGALKVNEGLVIAPSVQPNAPTAGQMYFDRNTNQLAFFNGTAFVPLTSSSTVTNPGVESINGIRGNLILGGGLSVVGNQINVDFPPVTYPAFPAHVSTIDGVSGDITVGGGLRMNGNTIQNSGVIGISAGSGISLADNGNGNFTITNTGVAGNVITTPSAGTSGTVPLFTGSQSIENSVITQSGSNITVAGDLDVTGGLTLGNALAVSEGGTGATSLASNGVVVANGTAPLTSVTASTAGLCFVSTVGAPIFAACPSATGVSSLNGLAGSLTVANASATGSTITINDATASTKGIASYNSANFSVSSGVVNTVQNISSTSTPTFSGVNTNTITPSGTLTIGSAAQSFTVQGTASSVFTVTGNSHNTTLGFNGAASGDVTYNLDRAVSAGTYGICTTAGNCVGVGGGITSPGGSTNRLGKFNGAQSLIDSSVSDDGTNVTVNGTASLVVQGGSTTLGTLTQAGTLVLSDGNSHTAALVISGLSANRTYTIPDAGANASFCLTSGNCVGGGTGNAPNAAEYLVANLNGTLTNERALAAGSNLSLTDGGANSTMTVATVQNPTFSTSVTTPLMQSSGALTISSATGQIIAIDAGSTIQLQDDTNVAGNFDVSGGLNAGSGNAFQISSAGAITAATGITSSGTVTLTGLNCTGNANGGALTTNGSGQLMCSDDDGGSGSAISGSGTSGKVALFSGSQTISNSIITQTGSNITIAGDLTLSTALSVANGGTGLTTFAANGLIYGNGTGALQVTAAGTGGQVLVADASGVPAFMSLSGDVSVSNIGAVAIQPNAVALGTDTTGNYVGSLGTLTGLTTSGNTGEGSTPTLSVSYGSVANTAVQGNITLGCPSGTGNLTGGGTSITLGTGGSCGAISTVNNPSFTTSVTSPAFILTGAGSNGTVSVGNLGQNTVYTLPDPGAAAATICISTGNCATTGAAGGDLTGNYPNPTIAKLQGTNLTISGPAAGQILVYNGTDNAWENHAVSGDIAISEIGVSTIQANSVALGTDTTGNYVAGVSAGTGTSIGGTAGEGWTASVSVLYGSTASTAVQGNQTISVGAGTNLSGGGSITLGAGGSVTLNVASSPVFAGTLTVQGATATIGTTTQAGSVVLSDGSSNTATFQTSSLGQNTTYTLPDPGSSSVTICLSTGNCAGAGGSVVTGGGSTNRLSKFDGTQSIANSSVSDDGSNVTINGSVNLVVQGGTSTIGTITQAGTLKLSDGSSNTVSIVASALSANRTYTLPDAGGDATLCVDSGNCIGGVGGAPNAAQYLVANLDGTLTNERALAVGSNLSLTDGGANGSMTVGIVNNPSFTTSVTTPVLQSSGALTITSATGQTVAIDAGTTIELQDSTNVTGNLDVSGSFTSGNANAFQISAAGAISAATGITSSGTITFSGLNCSTNANGGALTTNGSGQLMCSDDDGGSGSAISGSGTSGTITMFNGTQTITNSVITQSGTTVSIAGDLTLTTALTVANGGTGASSFTSKGLIYGNGTGALQVTAAGTSGQVLVANASGTPTFVSFSGDVAVSNTGATTIQADSVALGTDTTGNYVSNLGTLTGLSTSGNTGEGSTPTLGVNYGSIANTAVQGNVTLTCASGTGNLSGGGTSITLGAGGTCGAISTVNNPTFSTSVTSPALILTGAGSNGTIAVGNLGQGTVYTLPDPGSAAATICLSTGNCATTGAAGGDLSGTYPNPTIAKLQNTNLTISSPTAGQILVYNNTNSRWENHSVSGDIAISESGATTIQANAVALSTDTTGNYVLGLTAGTGVNVTGSAGEGWSPTVSVAYGATSGTAVEGNTSISVTAGTNLSGGGSITLGSGGTVTLNVASSPTFSGTLTVQGATASVGTTTQAGSVVLSDGSSNTGAIQTASLGQNTTYTLPDPGSSSATICLTSGNCAGTGTGVTTAGGTTNRLSKFTGAQAIGDSSISDNGTTVTINGSVNLAVQGGTSTIGTTTQAGTLSISDGSSNTVSIIASAFSADRSYTLPDVSGNATFCLSTGNCIGGGGGGAPSDATYLVTTLNGNLSNERSLTAGNNINFNDAGANGAFTIATVNNPTFSTSITTPALQSSGALTITSAAGQTVAIDAGTTIELQDSTNITGSLDVSAGFTSGTSNAFNISTAGAITSATGITSSGTITFSGLNCSTNVNGGALTTDNTGQLICSDDDGGAASTLTGSGTSGKIALFNGTNTLTSSVITQSGSTISIAGDLTLTTALTVANGGTGASSFTSKGLLYGNGTGALQVTAAGTSGQVMVAGIGGTPAFVSFSGDVVVSNTGATTIQADSVALGTDTTGNYVSTIGTLTGLTTSGNTGEGSTPTLSVTYGAVANSAVQGNVTMTCPSGSGNLTGGGTSITLGTGGSCGAISTVNNPTFSTSVTSSSLILTGGGSNGTVQVGTLGQSTVYTLPDPGSASATICISTGNCTTAGTAGGDLSGTYPNPTIAKLQNSNLTISGPSAGHVLVYNGTNSRWENHAVTGDVAFSETGATTIQSNSVALTTDTTGNYVATIGTLTGLTTSGNTGEGSTPTLSVAYGSAASTAVQGNTSISVTAGTNLSGGGSITLGAGGTVTLNVASSPTFSGTLTVQGASVTVGGNNVAGTVVLSDGAATSKTGTVKTNTLGQNTTFSLPDPGSVSATICLSTGNCAGSGSGVTTAGGTTNRLSKFTGAQAIGDSSISDNGTAVTINGSVNLVVQGGTSTIGTTTQAGTLAISDGSLNTISIVATGVSADRTYTLPETGGAATFCMSTGNCIGGGGGGAPSDATYLVTTLNGNLSNERSLTAGNNINFNDAGANGAFTIATINNPSFSTSVTTPALQSSGALTISSAAGNIVAIDAGTTIELQDSTNVTGNIDISGTFTSGTANAFTISSGGAITAATGITSSGTITFSGLNCSTNANGGALTANASGVVSCSDDDGAAGGTITGSGTNGTVALFNGANSVTNSIITQTGGNTIAIAGSLNLTNDLAVSEGGTGASSFTANGLLYGNGSSALQVTAAGTTGQVMVAGTGGIPAFVSFSGDVAVTNTGATTIQADSVALGTDTTGNYVGSLGTLTGLTTSGNTGEGSTPTLSVTYGSAASTAVQGNTTLTCPSGSGNLTGGGTSITLGTGGTCGAISTVASPTFSGTLTVQGASVTVGTNSVAGNLILSDGAVSSKTGTVKTATLGQNTTYTLPDPGSATANICLSTGNCAAAGSAGGDLSGSYPNPTIAKLQGSNLTITSPVAGNILVYNNTNSRWENRAISGDIVINETGVATVQADAVALGTDTTGNYVVGLTAGNGVSLSGTAGEGWSPTVSVVYGSSTNTAVQGNTSITVTAGTNLSGGGSITLGSGGTTTINVVSAPSFTGLTVTGSSVTIGANSVQGTLILDDGSALAKTATVKTSGTLGQNTAYNLPDPGAASATICLSTGNCSGSGSGVTTAGGTTNTIALFTGSQAIGNSILTQTGTTAINVAGNLNLTTGSTYQINGTQISSANLSNDANLAKLNASQTFTGGTVAFKNSADSTNAFNIQNTTNSYRLLTADTSGNQIILGQSSALSGKLVFNNISNANTVSIVPGTTTGNRTLTLPDVSGTICTDAGNCSGAAATLQSVYNNSVGGTTPKIKLNATLQGVDIQDADTTTGANLFNVRASNASGLGSVLFGVGNTGQTTVQTSSDSANTFRVLKQGGSAVLGVDTSANSVILGQGSSLAGALAFSNGSNANLVTLTAPTATAARAITLPDAAGTVCLQSSTACGFAASTGSTAYIQNQNSSAQTTSNFWISGSGRSDTSFITPSVTSATGTALTVTGATGLTANTTATNAASTASGDISISTGNATGATSNSGNITISNGTATGTAGGVNIGTTNTSAISLGRTGITTTNNGALTVTQGLAANGGLTLAVNQNITMTNGGGTFTQGYTASSGTASTLNLADSSPVGTTSVTGQSINMSGTNNSGGSNTITGLNFANVAAATNNSFYGINFGTGLTDLLRYNSTQLISGAGKLQNAAIDATVSYTNIQKVGGLTSGTINTGFGSITTTAAIQGGTGVFTNTGSLTLGTSSSANGSIIFNNGANANQITLSAPTATAARAISLPDAAGTVCLQGSTSCNFAPTTGGSGYIQNQNSSAQASSNFWISGNGRVDSTLYANTITGTTGDILIQSASQAISFGGSNYITASGGYTLQSGSNSDLTVQGNGTGALNLGTNFTAARVVNIGSVSGNNTTSTINIANSTTAAQTVSIGSTNGASSTTIAAGTGNLLLQTNSSSASITAKSSTNSTTAFQIQNASSSNLFGADTVNNVISINTGVGGALNTWAAQSTAMTVGAGFGATAIANGYIYSIGGYSSAYHTTVQYAPLKSNGSIGTWATTTPLPAARGFMMSSVVTYGNYVYVIGGSADGTNGVSTVYYAKLNPDGSVGPWGTASALPGNRLGPSAVVFNGRIYVLGGGTTGSVPTNTIYYAEINSDGALTPWVTDATTLPVTYSNTAAAVANGKVYYMGGTNAAGTSQTGVYYATIDPLTGDVGSFTTNGTSLPTATSSATATVYNGYMYIINGGVAGYYYAPITSAGAIGTWSSQISMSPMTARTGTPSAEYNGYFYAVGGFTGGAGQTAVYSTSAARTKVSGALDLVGATDGVVAGDGSVGGSLTAGDTSVVGTLNVQGQANFVQDVAISGNILVGVEAGDLNKYNTISVKSAGYSGLNLISDTTNASGEPGGAFLDMMVDSGTTVGTIGVTQNAGTAPDALTPVTNALQNSLLVGTTIGSGATQIISGDGAGNGVARITVVNGATTRVCIAMTACSNSTLGVTGTIKATSTITASTTPDIAETIAAAPDVEAADVVMADPNNTERVIKTNGAYQGAAVGVISDGTSSFMINSYGNSNFDGLTGAPLVLAGRVPVKVTMEGGQIKPGDYLTSSSIPGKAMKATHAGPTIGKALGFYAGANGDGTVLALINVSYYDPGSTLQGPTDGSYANLNASGNMTIGGNLTVTGNTTLGSVRINGKIMTGGNAPQVLAEAAASTGAQVKITGNDTAGRIEVTTGSAPTADDLVKLIFNSAYNGEPEVVITPVGKGSAAILPYVDAIDEDGFMVGAGTQPQANTTYVFTYHVLGVSP